MLHKMRQVSFIMTLHWMNNMKIRTKFLISICSIIIVSFAYTFYMTADFQDKLVLKLVENQARIISQQIILTRKWVADHNGIFLLKSQSTGAALRAIRIKNV